MSPQNCLAILSPPPIGSSPQKRRRSDERVGAEGEPERDSTDACGAANHRRAGNGGERSKAFGDFSTADEATAAQAETARVEGLLHGNRGKAPWNKTVSETIKQVVELARGHYQGFNDTHLTEKLKEKEKIVLSRPTVRTLLRQAGIAPVRKRGVKRHYKRRSEEPKTERCCYGTVAHIIGLGKQQAHAI